MSEPVYCDGVHLVCADLAELHRFAGQIGLKREWFRNGKQPHYDLTTARMVRKAFRAGAQSVATRIMLQLLTERQP